MTISTRRSIYFDHLPTKLFTKGHTPWSKGKKGVVKANSGSFRKGHVPAHAGRKRPEHSGKLHWHWRGGFPKCLTCNKQLSRREAKYCRSHNPLIPKGATHHSWRGGVTPIHEKIRKCLEYRIWRKAVFERDDYTCIWCKRRGVRIHADHIKPFSQYPELRFAIDNGRTLCVDCHKTTDSFGYHSKKHAKR